MKSITIDKDDLIELRRDGFLPIRTYIFLALKFDFPDGAKKSALNVAEFCADWELSQGEFLLVMEGLENQGFIWTTLLN